MALICMFALLVGGCVGPPGPGTDAPRDPIESGPEDLRNPHVLRFSTNSSYIAVTINVTVATAYTLTGNYSAAFEQNRIHWSMLQKIDKGENSSAIDTVTSAPAYDACAEGIERFQTCEGKTYNHTGESSLGGTFFPGQYILIFAIFGASQATTRTDLETDHEVAVVESGDGAANYLLMEPLEERSTSSLIRHGANLSLDNRSYVIFQWYRLAHELSYKISGQNISLTYEPEGRRWTDGSVLMNRPNRVLQSGDYSVECVGEVDDRRPYGCLVGWLELPPFINRSGEFHVPPGVTWGSSRAS